MRVALIMPAAGPRTGSRTYAEDIATLLAARHDVHRLDPAALRAPGAGAGLAERADLLHVLDAKSVLDAVAAVRRAPLPVVIDLHDDYWTGRPPYPAFDRPARRLRWRRQRPRYLALLARADMVAVHARHMLAAAGHDRARVVPIPVRPAPAGFAPAEPGPRLRVLFAGRDALRKGLPVLGDALRLVIAGGLNVEARVAGGDWAHLRAASRRWLRGVPATFAGDLSAEDMSRAYGEADLLAAPSYTEAFGLVVQEALVHGLPVAASRVGGLAEILAPSAERAATGAAGPGEPDGTPGPPADPGGILVPPGDALALAAAIREIALDPVRWRRRAREAGRVLAAARTPRAALDALDALYASAVEHRRAAP